MHPFYYPTTTIIIDDDKRFLDSFDYNLSDNILCKGFTNADKAMSYIMAQKEKSFDMEKFFSAHQSNQELDVSDDGDLFIKVHSTYWFNILQSPERFDEISVALVDYSMPVKDGIELCRELKDLPMKKIMLTGQADQKIAVNAFNEKIIDNFILKQEAEDSDTLKEVINKHTHEYFAEKTQSLSLAFSLQETRFLTNPEFRNIFETYLIEEQVDEYYVNIHPPGVLAFNKKGKPSLFMVYDEDRIRAHFEIAEEFGAPQPLLGALSNASVMPLFPTNTGYYHPLHADSWEQHVYPTQKIDGPKPLFLAIIQNADFVLKHLNRYVPFSQYKELDTTFVI